MTLCGGFSESRQMDAEVERLLQGQRAQIGSVLQKEVKELRGISYRS